jgi:hypothetical protein
MAFPSNGLTMCGPPPRTASSTSLAIFPLRPPRLCCASPWGASRQSVLVRRWKSPPAETDVITPQAFDHPDAQRRFRTVNNIEELERALEFPWEKWTVFLHPAQREMVERDYSGPARVSGSAGTGKTVVALHRAVFLARSHPDARVLLTTFSDTLANALRAQLRRLIHKRDPRLPSGHERASPSVWRFTPSTPSACVSSSRISAPAQARFARGRGGSAQGRRRGSGGPQVHALTSC